MRSYRVLGLDENITAFIKQGFESVLKKPDATLLAYMKQMYAKYTPQDMCKGGIRQRFER